MTFDWREYLTLADNLYSNCGNFPNKEACMRAAISRGYYAAFCTARNCARDNDGLALNNTGRDHGDVKNFYIGASDVNRKQVGNLLNRLRDLRNTADYKDVISGLEPSAQTAIALSQQVVTLLNMIYVCP